MGDQFASGVTITFTPIYKNKFLFVRRHKDDTVLPGYWCFPGGRVHVGETLAGALVRECLEETSLQSTGRAFFVDSYLLGDRVGVHFAVEVDSDEVTLQELDDHAWVDGPDDLGQFSPRIPGIENHLHYIVGRLQAAGEHAWQPLAEFDLVKGRFINP